jgi:integrin beta 3
MNFQEAFDAGFDAVKTYVERSFDAYETRLAFLEHRLDNLPAPKDGKDADMDEVRTIISDKIGELKSAIDAIEPVPELPDISAMVDAAIDARLSVKDMDKSIEDVVRMVVAEIPVPKDGIDGKDIDPEFIKTLVDDAVKAIPSPQDGKSVTIEDVAPLITAEVEKRVSDLPVPKDGKDGIDGRDGIDGKDGLPGIRGIDGADGKDGLGLAGAMIDRSGELVVTLTNGEIKNLGPVVGKDVDEAAVMRTIEAKFEALPKAKDGIDGLGFDDFEATFDGGKTVTLSFKQGERVKTFDFILPIMVYRGVFKEGEKYTTGDTVTWGGSLWHCGEDTSDKPETTKAWTLAAKRGRDGKDAVVRTIETKPIVRVGVASKKEVN